MWGFLLPYKSAGQKLSRVSLVTEMLKDSDLTRFVTSILPVALNKGLGHRTLIAFNAATLHDFIKRSKSVDDGTVAFLLPALLKPLTKKQKHVVKDVVVSLRSVLHCGMPDRSYSWEVISFLSLFRGSAIFLLLL